MANGHEHQGTRGNHTHDPPCPPDVSDPNLLAWAGRILYGEEHWRVSLADMLQVNRRSMQRWLNGTQPVPIGVWLMLQGYMAARVADQRLCIEVLRHRQIEIQQTEEVENVDHNGRD